MTSQRPRQTQQQYTTRQNFVQTDHKGQSNDYARLPTLFNEK